MSYGQEKLSIRTVAVGTVEKVTREGDEIFPRAEVSFTILAHGIVVVVEEALETTPGAAFTAGPLEKLGDAAMLGTGADGIERIAKASRVVPVEFGEEKLHANLADARIDFLQLLDLEIAGVVGGAGDELFDKIFS